MKGAAWLFLAAQCTMLVERDKLRKELPSKKEPEFDGWGSSQPIQGAGSEAKGRSG